MTQRKAIPKSVRFEVFKRDRFTCQYCGAKAPEAVLQVDHIHPVAEGGDNEIMNLVTACVACNSGKSDRKLSDQTALEKQRAELEQLEERRQQLEMMMEWRKAAEGYQQVEIDTLADEITSMTGFKLSEVGIRNLKKFRKAYEMRELLDAIDEAFAEGADTPEDFNRCFGRIPVICKWRRMYGQHGARYAYIQAILRNRFRARYAKLIPVIHDAHAKQKNPIEQIEAWARSAGSLEEFCDVYGFDWGVKNAQD